jgi:C-terminal processing protease CtpA/Prc
MFGNDRPPRREKLMLRIATFLLLFASLAALAKADVPPPYEPYGIGVTMTEGDPFPAITNVVAGSPAAQVGVKAGDGVIAIDGAYAKAGPPFYWFAKGLRGPQNSRVQLIILRDRQQVLVVPLVRTVRQR